MKRMWIAFLLLLTVCSAACAQEEVAVTAPLEGGMTPLFAQADETGEVLMYYYATTPVAVLETSGGFAYVRVGRGGAYLTGYMRMEELRFGAAAMREAERYVGDLCLPQRTAVYTEPREDAPVLYMMDEYTTFFTIGENDDGWVQLSWPYGSTGDDRGFVLPGEAEIAAPKPTHWHVLPLEGELNDDEARERAIEIALEYAEGLGMDEAFTTREGLEAMAYDIRLLCGAHHTAYTVYINVPGDYGGKGISLMMTPQGELLTIETCVG